MTAAERATLSYSRGQMIASILLGLFLAVMGWALVSVGIGYGVILLIPVFAADIAMYLIGYTMHTAAADTVTARHLSERETIVIKAGVVTTQTDDERRQTERRIMLWWSEDTNRTTKEATIAQFRVSQQTWESVRNQAVMMGLAEWQETAQGKRLLWTASQSATIRATA